VELFSFWRLLIWDWITSNPLSRVLTSLVLAHPKSNSPIKKIIDPFITSPFHKIFSGGKLSSGSPLRSEASFETP
jgi:hypothetical protein